MRGDFGVSISLHRSVLELLAERLPATLELAIAACLVAVVLGGATAILGTLVAPARWRGRDRRRHGLLLAVPDFIWALFFVLLLGVLWPVLPLSGRIDPTIGVPFVTHFYLTESLLTGAFRHRRRHHRPHGHAGVGAGVAAGRGDRAHSQGSAAAKRWCRTTCCSRGSRACRNCAW